MDRAEIESVEAEVNALAASLDEERFRHVAGLEPEPLLQRIFEAHSRAAHRETAAALHEAGEHALADKVAELRVERAAAVDEERWRAADATAGALGPDGEVLIGDATRAVLGERNRERRVAFGRALAQAFSGTSAPRESAAETRARARVEVGIVPDRDRVADADGLLNETRDGYADVLAWLARREIGIAPLPEGDLDRADLMYLLALPKWQGLFRRGMLSIVLAAAIEPLGIRPVQIDEADRSSQWLGAHAVGSRISLRRMGGAADYLELFAATGIAAAARASPFHARDPAFPEAVGTLLRRLLLEPRFLAERLDVGKRHAPDLIRALALRELFRLRTHAAALRVAAEVERGASGASWHDAHRDALSAAALARWPAGLAARDADSARHLQALVGAAEAEALRRDFTECFDEDWWRNPRAPAALAALLAAGGRHPDLGRPTMALAWSIPLSRLERR